jgi:hypothetical protein
MYTGASNCGVLWRREVAYRLLFADSFALSVECGKSFSGTDWLAQATLEGEAAPSGRRLPRESGNWRFTSFTSA